MKNAIFQGVATALVTPFDDNGIDFPALERLIELQLNAGIPALVLSGTTGEGSTLSLREKSQLWSFAAGQASGRAKLIAGIGTNDTKTSIHLAQEAANCGADVLLAVTPYYNKCSQEGLIAHYTALADATELPLLLYNVPSRTGVNILPETCQILQKHPKINGIKEAGGNISQSAKLRSVCPDFPLWSGNDDQIVPIMALGGRGVISVLSNIRPGLTIRLVNACMRGDYTEAAKLQAAAIPLIEALFSDVNPIPVKAALASMGLCREILRLPLTPLGEKKRRTLLAAMEYCP